jgi:hypothetical protein
LVILSGIDSSTNLRRFPHMRAGSFVNAEKAHGPIAPEVVGIIKQLYAF